MIEKIGGDIQPFKIYEKINNPIIAVKLFNQLIAILQVVFS